MDDEVKDRVIVMNRAKSRETVDGQSPASLPRGKATALRQRDGGVDRRNEPGGATESFDPESGDYKAFGVAGNKTLPSLIIILKDGSECGINYADLATAWPGGSMFLPSAPGCKGNVIRLRIAGDDGVFTVIIEGVRLRRGWELIMGHKMLWIHELPAGMDFNGDDEPEIRSVTFQRLLQAAAA
jgi:hypothetical protein